MTQIKNTCQHHQKFDKFSILGKEHAAMKGWVN